jgi:hypothetical protein
MFMAAVFTSFIYCFLLGLFSELFTTKCSWSLFFWKVLKWKYCELYLAKYGITTFTESQAEANEGSMNVIFHALKSNFPQMTKM